MPGTRAPLYSTRQGNRRRFQQEQQNFQGGIPVRERGSCGRFCGHRTRPGRTGRSAARAAPVPRRSLGGRVRWLRRGRDFGWPRWVPEWGVLVEPGSAGEADQARGD
uniref:(northern house mosquito) hypothetical protein n=1 Tax=Culex pipiens TaxID=7175 RepID=A0A8D8NUH8_CULPI